MILSMSASVIRKVQNGADYSDTQIYTNIKCEIVPISSFDQVSSFARESTHIIWVSRWTVLRKEDKFNQGRRPVDAEGDPVRPFVYTINGVRSFKPGIPQRAYYAREMD